MDTGKIDALLAAVRKCGGRLTLSLDGRLVTTRWQDVTADLQQQVAHRSYEVVAFLCRDSRYRLTGGRLAQLRGWAALDELNTVTEALWAQPGVKIPAGEAGGRATFWLACYDAGHCREHHEWLLRGLYYGVLVYRQGNGLQCRATGTDAPRGTRPIRPYGRVQRS